MKYPDANKHFWVSIIKSIVRIFAGLFLIFGNFILTGVFLMVAEVIGIIEELV